MASLDLAFEQWCLQPDKRLGCEYFVVGRIDDETANLMGGIGSLDVLLSSATLVKQQLNHPDVKLADYERLQLMLDSAEMRTDRDQHFALIDDGTQSWLAVIKVTKSGEAIWLQSLRRTNRQDVERLRGRSVLLREWVDE